MSVIPYTRHRVDPNPAFPCGEEIPRVLCWVGIKQGGKHSTVIQAMIDTGSDYCVFPADVLDELGIDKGSLPLGEIRGMGEAQNIYYATVTLWVKDVGEWEVYAGFSEYLRITGSGLLGFRGFLERFKIVFDPSASEVTISPSEVGYATSRS
jgi:hypothetical protein